MLQIGGMDAAAGAQVRLKTIAVHPKDHLGLEGAQGFTAVVVELFDLPKTQSGAQGFGEDGNVAIRKSVCGDEGDGVVFFLERAGEPPGVFFEARLCGRGRS